MATDTMMRTCASEDIGQMISCYEKSFGCSLNREGPGPCAALDCPDGSLFVCEKTPESKLSALHDVLGDDSEAQRCDTACGCC